MTRAGDVYDRLRERKEHGILGGYHDRPITVSIWGAPEPSRCLGYFDPFKVASLLRDWAQQNLS